MASLSLTFLISFSQKSRFNYRWHLGRGPGSLLYILLAFLINLSPSSIILVPGKILTPFRLFNFYSSTSPLSLPQEIFITSLLRISHRPSTKDSSTLTFRTGWFSNGYLPRMTYFSMRYICSPYGFLLLPHGVAYWGLLVHQPTTFVFSLFSLTAAQLSSLCSLSQLGTLRNNWLYILAPK